MDRAPALSHGLAIVRLLAAATEPLPAGSIAARLDLPRSSVYHLLAVLVDAGFVLHYPNDQRYGLGVTTFEIGTAYLRQERLERLGRPVLERLVRSTRSTAHLGILLGRDLLYLVKQDPPQSVSLVTEVGVRLPAHLTASGRSLLAALDQVELNAIYPSGAGVGSSDGHGSAHGGRAVPAPG
jgi:DNA-binding IclR family transcriptional regulator